MDAVFLLDEGGRSNFVQIIMQSFGCSYVCLWSFLRPSSCLYFLDGLYGEAGNSRSTALFNEYKQSVFIIQPSHGQVPGLAFRNNTPYIEVREEELLTLASNAAQRQFYQETRIKTATFMGCRSGEIELGFSNMPQADLEMQMMSLFPEDFSRQLPLSDCLPISAENPSLNPPSSSSSSLRSLSLDSPEYSSLLFSLPTTASSSSQPLLPAPNKTTTTTATIFPTLSLPMSESEHAAITRAFITVLTSPSLPSTSQQQQQQSQQQQQQHLPRESLWRSAFTRFSGTQFKPSNFHRQSMLKRTIAYCRSMNLIRLRERLQAGVGGGKPASTTQMHHMMSERKRREKLNESFQSLKALLPPGTKKDKASVLATTREYLSSLKAKVEDLRRKNAILEAQLLPPSYKEAAVDESGKSSSSSENRSRFDVTVRTVSDSASTSSHDRTVDLQVILRRDIPTIDLMIRILEFLKQVRNVNVISIDAVTRVMQQNVVNHVSLRLNVEGDEWDESAFQEAVRRVVADLAH